jgi:EAL domain-containing protein (putative c-di-GMP-specific phosphodiesterase class I)
MSDYLTNNDLRFAVQRISSLSGGKIYNWFEWLIRPRDVEPCAFVDAVESLGDCLELDQLVVRKSLAWLARQPIDTRLSINVFASSVSREEFLDYVIQEIADQEVSPQQICFEITEHHAISNLANASRFVRLLRRFGVQIALDDLGTGSIHMGLLVPACSVDFLKIDRCWVTPAIESQSHRQKLDALIAFGRRIGVELILEGVETEAHLSLVREMEVDYYQGFYDGHPILIKEEMRDVGIQPRTQADGWLQIA